MLVSVSSFRIVSLGLQCTYFSWAASTLILYKLVRAKSECLQWWQSSNLEAGFYLFFKNNLSDITLAKN